VIDEPAQRSASRRRPSRSASSQGRDREIIAKIARIPPRSVSTDDRSALANLDRDLKAVVVRPGQAIGRPSLAIKMARSGLGNPQKPIGKLPLLRPHGRRQDRSRPELALLAWESELLRFDIPSTWSATPCRA